MKELVNVNKDYNILSIDGGGIRGLVVLKQLIYLEEQLGEPIYKHFDLISGTSTGGIIATFLALGYSAKSLLEFYTKDGKLIFEKKWYRFGIFRPKYDDSYFNEVLLKYTDGLNLTDTLTDILIVGYDATRRDKIIFKSRKAKYDEKYNYSLYDVIRSTAAAPTFFKPYKIDKRYIIDGGLVINNPSMISWVEALNYNDKEFKKINIISFSTGNKELPLNNKVIRGGILQWAFPSVQILLNEQAQTTDYHMNALFKRENGMYLRCNSVIKYSSFEIDDVRSTNISNMLVDGDLSLVQNKDNINEFIKKIK